jgi:hypothetical protein
MQLHIEPNDLEVLRNLVVAQLNQVTHELHRTRTIAYRDDLKKTLATLQELQGRLVNPEPASISI